LLVAFVGLAVGLSGCSSIHFLYQAGKGQLRLLNRARPLQDVIDDPRTDPKMADLLKQVAVIKKFGETYGLKPTPNYQDYVKLDQDAVVYVVTVSEALQFKPKIFSFPIVGSFNYLGWFGREDAEKFAAQFEKAGDDVDLRGASAYSTLGWFKDPLLSTMIPSRDGIPSPDALPELVNVVIHESVHATLYLNDQSYFNESLAVFVADILTEKYFKEKGLIESQAWKNYVDRRDYFVKMQERMSRAYQDLKKVYDSKLSDEEKRSQKKTYIDQLQSELKFRRPITNATLIQFQTYDPSDHGFGSLFKKYHENIPEFFTALQKLKKSDFKKEHETDLKPLLEKL
jgi:predicted aminopeptidase